MIPEEIRFAFAHGQRVEAASGPAELECRTVGQVHLPSGSVVACDPVYSAAAEPFARAVPPGDHRFILTVAHFEDEKRIAYAGVQFTDGAPAAWEMATVAGQRAAKLKPNEFYGFAVDSGVGCYMDADCTDDLADHFRSDQAGAWADLVAQMASSNEETLAWALVGLANQGAAGAAIFDSGAGDGIYPSFFGLDGRGRVVCLVTDLRLLAPAQADQPRRWWQFLKSTPRSVPTADPAGRQLDHPKGLCVRTRLRDRDSYAAAPRRRGHQCHYRKPLSLGGRHTTANMVFVQRTVHRQPHPPAQVLDAPYGAMLG